MEQYKHAKYYLSLINTFTAEYKLNNGQYIE